VRSRALIAVAVALIAAGCTVPGQVPGGSAAPGGPQGPAADGARIPSGSSGSGSVNIEGTPGRGTQVSDTEVGAFRTICLPSHMAKDDPIVKPGAPGASHLHTFFGNTAVNASTTSQSLRTIGNSTCRGGIVNRSGYWVPSIIDTATGAAINPVEMIVYYKSGYQGVLPSSIVAPPAGLRMISGTAAATSPTAGEAYNRPANWVCNPATDPTQHAGIPTSCGAGSTLGMMIRFPQCWDGINLDSPDHKSHMAWPTWGPEFGKNGAGCPATHPVALPEITFNVYFLVPPGGASNWRLASDMYSSGPGGYSLHADWWNGWDPAIMNVWIANCVRGSDCSTDFLGDGRRLV
jgi:Domain of unknown function (DUF1996)